jgi:hypothetical protein
LPGWFAGLVCREAGSAAGLVADEALARPAACRCGAGQPGYSQLAHWFAGNCLSHGAVVCWPSVCFADEGGGKDKGRRGCLGSGGPSAPPAIEP